MVELIAAVALLADPMAAMVREAKGRVGAAAEILEQRKTVLSLNRGARFPMQSVYKLPIGMAALAEVDRGKLKLEQTVHVDPSEYVSAGQHSPLRDAHPGGADVKVGELLELAVSQSDGTASDVLLRLTGGPAAVMQYLASAGVREVKVRDREMDLGRDFAVQYRNWSTPGGAISILRALQESRGLSAPSRDLLMRLMRESKTFPGRIKGLLAAGTVVAHKTGSSGARNGITAATNDIGIVTLPDGRHLAIAVFVSDSAADDQTRDRVIAKIARAAWDACFKN
jgi:beta-lactamase class A